jgi:hypothetical protein
MADKPNKKRKLVPRQKQFIKPLASGMTQTDAAKAAGYRNKSPKKAGYQAMEQISGSLSRLLIVQILVSLGIRTFGFDKTTILYAEANEYPPTKEKVQEALTKSDVDPLYSIMLLSSAVFDVMVVPELLSISLDGQQTRLVAFPSFTPTS